MAHQIIETCTACGLCVPECPIDAIIPGEPISEIEDTCCDFEDCLAVCPVDAIDALADLLLLMHMVQHILLLMVAPPLILLGLPMPLIRWLIQETKLRGGVGIVDQPAAGLCAFQPQSVPVACPGPIPGCLA